MRESTLKKEVSSCSVFKIKLPIGICQNAQIRQTKVGNSCGRDANHATKAMITQILVEISSTIIHDVSFMFRLCETRENNNRRPID